MAGGAVLAFSGKSIWAASADSRIEVFLDEPKGEISPNIYGQFTEHIGGVIYDGVWVGPNSKIRNQYGIRSELVEKMKEIHVPIVRWPGGCFADSYDWKDGIGPASQRPKRTNFCPTNLAQMSLCASASSPGRSRTWLLIYGVFLHWNLTIGWNTATLPREAPRWPRCAQRRVFRTLST